MKITLEYNAKIVLGLEFSEWIIISCQLFKHYTACYSRTIYMHAHCKGSIVSPTSMVMSATTTVCLSWIFHNQSVFVDLFSKLTVSKCFIFCSNNSLPQPSNFDCTHAPDTYIQHIRHYRCTSIGVNHLIKSDTSISITSPVNTSLLL